MKPRCLTTIRMSMTATLLHQSDEYNPFPVDPDEFGTWVESQDPLTGEIVRVWTPFPDDVDTPTVDESVVYGTIPCIARGIVDGGIRVAGTTERFGDTYENIDFVKLWVPAHLTITTPDGIVETKISKRDRVTNIRDKHGHIIWIDEEFSDPAETEVPRATMFNVNGVTPLLNAWNEHVESFVLLERAEVNGPE